MWATNGARYSNIGRASSQRFGYEKDSERYRLEYSNTKYVICVYTWLAFPQISFISCLTFLILDDLRYDWEVSYILKTPLKLWLLRLLKVDVLKNKTKFKISGKPWKINLGNHGTVTVRLVLFCFINFAHTFKLESVMSLGNQYS